MQASHGTQASAMRYLVSFCVVLSGTTTVLRAEHSFLATAWNDVRAGSGMLAAINTQAPWSYAHSPIPIGMDSVLYPAFGKLFTLSAAERVVQVVDPVTWTVERSYPLGPGGELADIKVVSPQTAYITRRDAQRLLRLDLASGAVQESVDLSGLADSDGIPDLGSMAVHDRRLFVQLQRLNFDDPPKVVRPSIAVVDLNQEQLIDVDPSRDGIQAIELMGTFPKMKMHVVAETSTLAVSSTGAFFDAGGIELIDLENLRSQGLAIRENDDNTGADLGAFVMVGADRGFLAYTTDLLLSSHLHQFSLTEGVDPRELAVTLNYFSPAIEFDPESNTVFFPVGGSLENGFYAFDATTGARLNGQLIPTAGSPTDVVLVTAIPEPRGIALAVVSFLAFSLGWRVSCSLPGDRR